MIETVTDPPNLLHLKTDELPNPPLYFEFFGETKPTVDLNYAQILPGGSVGTALEHEALLSVYQYWWTLGHFEKDLQDEKEDHSFMHWFPNNEDDAIKAAATIQVCFPLQGNWRAKEIVPSVKYLKPLHEQMTSWHSLGGMLHEGAPLLSAATGVGSFTKVMSAVANPLAGGLMLSTPALMSMVAKLHINEVPPTDGMKWEICKVTHLHSEFGPLAGVTWKIPKKMFRELGGRLTGSLTTTFIPYTNQQSQKVCELIPDFQCLPILARAIVHLKDDIQLPEGDFLKLYVHPYVKEIPQRRHTVARRRFS